MSKQGMIDLSRAADQVRGRVAGNAFRSWLAAGRWWVPILALAAILVMRLGLGLRSGEWIAVAALVVLFLVVGGIRALLVRPRPLSALALWDERGGHKDLFSSAFGFLAEDSDAGTMPEGRKLHVQRALSALPDAVARLSTDLPAPRVRFGWLTTALVMAFAFTPWLRPAVDPSDTVITEEMAAEAERQAEELAKQKAEIEKIAGLTEEEKREMAELGTDVEGLSEDLANSDGKTAREVLEGLEGRARAAERLAEKLGAGSDEWASEEMLREMSQHADTADLAAAIKDKNAKVAAIESDKVAGTLKADDLKIETQDRVTTALERTISVATPDDVKKPVGERVGNASRKMEDKQPKPAAGEFEELAKHFRLVEQREAAEEKLRDLADQLREAGGSISGSKLEKVEKLASSGQKGQEGAKGESLKGLSQAGQSGQPAMTPMTPTPGAQNQQGQGLSIGTGQNMPIPGVQNPQGQGQQQGNGQGSVAMPVPGTGQQGQTQQGMAMGQGQGQKPGQGQGLMAPIPGMTPGSGAPGAGLGAMPGAGAASAGGDQAGTGTAALGNQATEAMKATKSAQVVAQTNADGESTVKAIQGQERTEQVQRQGQEIVKEFIAVEEEAIDEQALPASRRDHVLRYFTAIRESFEKKE
ncbi:MAG: hypothetical protein JNK37_24700 [Verrucomicrobiales bacterium]|nr:hypothetical protein [Verrucomicrobiales bacterium]